MPNSKSSFLDRVLGRIGRLDAEGLQTVVQRLARERHFLETLFNTIEDGVLVVDENARIIYFNQAVTYLLGLPEDADEGHPVQRYLPDLDWDKLLAFDASGGKHNFRQEFEVNYPRARFLRLYGAPLDGETSGTSGLALILHDATEARQKTFEAIESERIQALTLLAASVAHEIGNPLNALHIHSQLMERELRKLKSFLEPEEKRSPKPAGKSRPKSRSTPLAEDVKESTLKLEKYLGVAKGEISRLDYIVTQFLQAIRPTQPKLQLASLNDIVHETLELLKPELENRGLTVSQDLDQQLPYAPVDGAQIKQVMVNLVKNAMHAMTKGGKLTLETGWNSDAVWVSVADTGGGISQEKINRIFEPFFTTKKKGSGLGLMIVQRIVREHGGRIELESYVGQGTTFRIWLPLHERQPRLLEEATREPQPSGAANEKAESGGNARSNA